MPLPVAHMPSVLIARLSWPLRSIGSVFNALPCNAVLAPNLRQRGAPSHRRYWICNGLIDEVKYSETDSWFADVAGIHTEYRPV